MEPAPILVKFALAVYGTDDVGAACLYLQGKFGLDVNLVLFAAFVGAVRGEALTEENLHAAHRRVDAWHAEVVRPLRAVRQRLKSGPSPAPDDRTAKVRTKIQQSEIEAELIELAELGEPGWMSEAPQGSGNAAQRAATAIATLIDGPMDDADREAIATIAAAAASHAGSAEA